MQKSAEYLGMLTLKAALEGNKIAEFIQQEREKGVQPANSRQLARALCLSVKPALASAQKVRHED